MEVRSTGNLSTRDRIGCSWLRRPSFLELRGIELICISDGVMEAHHARYIHKERHRKKGF